MMTRVSTFIRWLTIPLNFFLLLLSIIPLFFVLRLIKNYAANVPYWDQWDTSLRIAVRTVDRTLTFQDLLAQHSEHRIFFTNLLTAAMTLITRWDTRFEMLFSVGMAALTFLLLLAIFYKQQPHSILLALLPFSALIFSLRQIENWLWGFQATWFFAVLFYVSGIWLLSWFPIGWPVVIGAAFFALSSTFSFSIGLATWPLYFVGLWLFGYRKWRYYVFWILATIISLWMFFSNYVDAPATGERTVRDFTGLVTYVMVYMAGPMSSHTPDIKTIMLVFLMGCILFWGNSVYIWQQSNFNFRSLAPWWLITGFSLSGAIMASIGRAQLGIFQALSSRYVTISSLFWVAVVALTVMATWNLSHKVELSQRNRLLLLTNILLSVLLIGFYLPANLLLVNGSEWRATGMHEACLRNYPVDRNLACLEGIYPVIDVLPDRINAMERRHLGIFGQFVAKGRKRTLRGFTEYLFSEANWLKTRQNEVVR